MKKLMFIAAVVMGLSGVAVANCGNDNGNGNGCSGNTGPQGPQGPAGLNGTNGTNGKDGVNGTNGTNAPAPDLYHAKMVAGLDVRLFDTRYVSLHAFDDFNLDRRMDHDVLGSARNDSFGARLVIKLGRDYTEDRIDELEKKIKRLEALSH